MSQKMEERLLERRCNRITPGASYEKVMRYERLVDIHLHRAMAGLAKKRQTENRIVPQNEIRPRSSQAHFRSFPNEENERAGNAVSDQVPPEQRRY